MISPSKIIVYDPYFLDEDFMDRLVEKFGFSYVSKGPFFNYEIDIKNKKITGTLDPYPVLMDYYGYEIMSDNTFGDIIIRHIAGQIQKPRIIYRLDSPTDQKNLIKLLEKYTKEKKNIFEFIDFNISTGL